MDRLEGGGGREDGLTEVALAVDVGGTNIRAALVDRCMTIHRSARRPIDKSSSKALLEAIGDCAAEVAGGPGLAAGLEVAGIGVAMKGFIDHRNGVMIASANLGLRDVRVRSFLQGRFRVPTWVDNDVHAATIGEIHYGAGRRWRDFVYLNVGTGIAAGMVLDGKLHRGTANLSGEFGHTTVNFDGKPCHCGMRGCLERVVSGPGIEEWYRCESANDAPRDSTTTAAFRQDPPGLRASAVLVLGAARGGAARRVLEAAVEYLGAGIVNLVNLLNPQAVILGGGVFHDTADFARRLESFVRSRAAHESAECLEWIAASSLDPENAGMIGAASLVWEGIKVGWHPGEGSQAADKIDPEC